MIKKDPTVAELVEVCLERPADPRSARKLGELTGFLEWMHEAVGDDFVNVTNARSVQQDEPKEVISWQEY